MEMGDIKSGAAADPAIVAPHYCYCFPGCSIISSYALSITMETTLPYLKGIKVEVKILVIQKV